MTLLTEAGAHVIYDIPDREEGYALNTRMIDEAYTQGIRLMITCDNGITCHEQVDYAKTLGIQVIVTDHHEPQGDVPDTIVINPKQYDCPYPFKELAGVGVAWKVGFAVLSQRNPLALKEALDVLEVVSIGTVADIVPLVDENRVLVAHGLQQFAHTSSIGLQALLKALELDPKDIQAHHIGFRIGPTLNATGRLVSAKEAVNMLLESSKLKAFRSAKYLAELNKERQDLTKQYAESIIDNISRSTSLEKYPVIVYRYSGIPEGIVGIIASQIKEKFHHPILLMTQAQDGTWKGSGRSIESYNMFEEIMKHRDLFIKAGGHAMACGFSIEEGQIDALEIALNEDCPLTEDDLMPTLRIDYDIDPRFVTYDFAIEIDQMRPFGKGNPKPLFQMTDLKVVTSQIIGKDKNHIKLELCVDDQIFTCIGFNLAHKWPDILAEFPQDEHMMHIDIWVNIAFSPGINEFRGRKTLQLELKDIKSAK